jgi:hypothetical protein
MLVDEGQFSINRFSRMTQYVNVTQHITSIRRRCGDNDIMFHVRQKRVKN